MLAILAASQDVTIKPIAKGQAEKLKGARKRAGFSSFQVLVVLAVVNSKLSHACCWGLVEHQFGI